MPDGQTSVASGDTNIPSSGGEAGNVNAGQDSGKSDEGKQDDVVAYRTYSKVLTEKKNVQERMKAIEAERDELKRERETAEENKLKEQNEYKTLYEKTKQQLDEKDGKFNGLVNDIHKQRKIAAFTSALKGSVDPEYHLFIKTEEILMDPESGDIDEMSVTKEVERFLKKHPQLIARPHEKRSTSVYPQGESHQGDTIARSEWLKLPAKDMRKWRMSQIRDND